MKKIRLKMVGLAVALLGIVCGKLCLQAQAAEPPVIGDLKVMVSQDGQNLTAYCSYQDYDDQSGCTLTLYLYQVAESRSYQIVACKNLPFAAAGEESTDAVAASEGIYVASVTLDYGGTIKQIHSAYFYQMERTEDAHMEPPESIGCSHVFDYTVVQEATPDQDCLLAYQCTVCGAVAGYEEVPNSAYAAFLAEAENAILHAQTDSVVIETTRWISFDQKVLAAMAQRRDVTVVVRYRYQGKSCQVIVPAEAAVEGLADENGFCGFRYLELVFG